VTRPRTAIETSYYRRDGVRADPGFRGHPTSGHDRIAAATNVAATKGAVVSPSPDPSELQRVWDTNAAFWDDFVGADGNDFHRVLVAPAQIRNDDCSMVE
jgi:hypothetical protein